MKNRRVAINAHLASFQTLLLAEPFGAVRLDANCDRNGIWDIEPLDHSVFNARHLDLEVMLSMKGPAGGVENWPQAVRFLCNRYRHNVWHWSIWNEPNRENFWDSSMNDFFNKILIPAAETIHEVGEENRVIGPEITLMDNWHLWLQRTIQRAGQLIDIISVHSYTSNGREVMRAIGHNPRTTNVVDVLRGVRSDHPIWLTETGWVAENAQGEAHQADSVDQILETLPSFPRLERVFFYQLIDEPSEKRGFFREDQSPKPVMEIVRERLNVP